MGSLLQDLRYGARTLLKNPGFTLIAVITLSLGIGANTAVFSVVYGVLLKPLPYKDAERIVVARVSPPDFRDLKEATQVFDRMAIWGRNRYNVTINRETTQVLGATVSPEFLPNDPRERPAGDLDPERARRRRLGQFVAAAREFPHDGTTGLRFRGAAAAQHSFTGGVCGAGAGARGRRNLRRDRLFGQPARA